MAQILFGIQSYQSRSKPLSNQRVVNCFLEKQPEGAKSQVPVFGAPGLTVWTTLPESPHRGEWNFNGVLYVVAGASLYSVSPAGVYTKIGTGITGINNVSISDNGVQLVIVNGVGGWIYCTTNNNSLGVSGFFDLTLQPNFYPAHTVLFFDGYFVFDRVGSNEFFLSALYDGTSYSGLDFASAEAQPGFLIAVAQNLQLLFLFCQNHIEMWYDAGAADFPFQRYAGGVIEKGCAAPLTVIVQDEAIFFLGTDLVFYRLQGNVPVRVSTHAVEHAFAQYGDVSDAFCFTYTLEGHKMVHLTFPSVPHSWVFDLSTSMWHERVSLDNRNIDLKRWRGNCALRIYNMNLIGDFYTGTLWNLDWDAYKEGTNTMPMIIDSAPLHQDRQRVFVTRLELDMEVGVGLTTGQGSNPQAMLQWSKDGGKTYSTLQPWRSMGKIGEYLRRMRWMSLGEAYQWNFRLVITDPVKRVLIAAHADVEIGME
jgi:hypothetical protein